MIDWFVEQREGKDGADWSVMALKNRYKMARREVKRNRPKKQTQLGVSPRSGPARMTADSTAWQHGGSNSQLSVVPLKTAG